MHSFRITGNSEGELAEELKSFKVRPKPKPMDQAPSSSILDGKRSRNPPVKYGEACSSGGKCEPVSEVRLPEHVLTLC